MSNNISLSEYLNSEGGGIFSDVFSKDYPSEFEQLFPNTDPEVLDAITDLYFGDRTLSAKVSANPARYVRAIIKTRLSNWLESKKLVSLCSEVDASTVWGSEVRTSERTQSGTNNYNTTDGKKVFNDEDFQEYGQKEDSRETTEKESANTRSDKMGFGSFNAYTNFVKEQRKANRGEAISTTVIKDIVNEITLLIYQ